MREVILLIGLEKWKEKIGQKDQGMGYFLGFGYDVPFNLVEETKIHLEEIWNKRVKKFGI